MMAKIIQKTVVLICIFTAGLLFAMDIDLSSMDVLRGRMFQAADSGDVETILALYRGGVDPNVRDDKRRTPLMRAAAAGQERVVAVLCNDCHADVDETTKSLASRTFDYEIGRTALGFAAQGGNEAIIRLLCAHGANVHAFQDPVRLSSEDQDIAEEFGQFEDGTYMRTTALSVAAVYKHVGAVLALCEFGAALHAQTLLRDLYRLKIGPEVLWSIDAMPVEYRGVCMALEPFGAWKDRMCTAMLKYPRVRDSYLAFLMY